MKSLLLPFMLLVSTAVQYTRAYTEQEILEEFYQVANGDNWNNKDGWEGTDESGSKRPICSWHGIVCSSKDPTQNEGVTDINLQNNNLEGFLQGLVWKLPHLVYLNLKGNKLTNAGFEEIVNQEGAKVQIVDLTDNLITTIKGIGNAPHDLRWLFLSNNKISGPLPDEITGLDNMRKLHLDNNMISGSIPEEIGGMHRLLELNLAHNLITGTIPADIGRLSSLQVLNLNENTLHGTIPTEVNSLINLKSLNLQNSEGIVNTYYGHGAFTGTIPSFRDSVFLTTIQLGGNEFTGTIPSDLIWNSGAEADDLITIGLANNHLTGSVPETLMRFDNVYLDIVGNELTTLSSGFCDKSKWMNSKVESYGCEAIMCGPGDYNERYARREVTGDEGICKSCEAEGLTVGTFFGAFSCADHSETKKEKELAALIAFYHDLTPAKWKKNDGWSLLDNDGDDDAYYYVYTESLDKVCEFKGITCNDEGRVKSIELSDNGLHGQIHPAIFKLEYLEVLNLSYNKIWMHGFEGLEDSTSLTYLDISGTDITSMEGISQAAYSLEYLFINDLVMFDHDIREVFDCENLIDFTAKNSGIKGKLLDYDITKLTQLLRLDLYGNDLSGNIPEAIGSMTNLEEINLSENLFEGPIPASMNNLVNLQELRIRQSTRENGGLTGVIPAFDNLPNIEVIEFDFNSLKGPIPANFLNGVTTKTNPIKVGLAYNLIGGKVPVELEYFSAMSIDLIGNEITELDDSFSEMQDWMNGQVGSVGGKNAIMCPPKTYTQFGKAFVLDETTYNCLPCDTAEYFGETYCGDNEESELEILVRILTQTGYKESLDGLISCKIPGVTCTGGGKVEEIDWRNFELSGEVSGDIWSLPQLNVLDLRKNQVTLDFDGIDQSIIRDLHLSDTNVKSIEGIRGASTSLKKLDINRNDFTGEIPSDIYDLKRLSFLHMDYNHFFGTIGDSMKELKRLVDFSCKHCGLSGSLYNFEENQNLKKLDLSFNDFYGEISDVFMKTVNKTQEVNVQLAYNELEGAFPGEMARFDKLYINLTGNMLTSLDDTVCEDIWMGGETLEMDKGDECNAILCPPGEKSKTLSGNYPCEPCPEPTNSQYYGSTSCAVSQFADERSILEELYSKMNGADWYRQNKWRSEDSICTWYGVGCGDEGDEDGHVTHIILDNNNLVVDPKDKEEVANLLFSLEYIHKIDLSGNEVTLSFANIGRAKSTLHSLYLSGTSLEGDDALDGIGNAKSLHHLRIEDNGITGTIPTELYELIQLRSLHISNNDFKGSLDGNGLRGIVNLEEMYASNNRLNGEIPTELGQLVNLRVLDLGRNILSSVVPEELGALTKLKQLSLENQRGQFKISGKLPDLANMESLEILELQGNEMRDKIPDNFLENSKVKDEQVWINMDYNQITGTIPSSLTEFKRLYLGVIGNKMSKFPDSFCESAETTIGGWMDGAVGKYGCKAIGCPPNSFSASGRETDDIVCRMCSSSNYSGSTVCSRGADEKAILKALYIKLGGETWVNQKYWMDDSIPICKWDGVKCEDGTSKDNGGVTTLDFTSNGLVGGVPDVIFSLPFLRGLILKDNDITISFANMKTATALERLNLSETRIDSIDGISAAKNLEVLHLTDNNLYGPIDEFCKLTNLQELYVAYNHFSGKIPPAIGDLKHLEYFYAYANDLTGTVPTEIGKLYSLEHFVLSENLISGQLPDEIGSLPNLQLLSFYRHLKSGPKLTGTLPSFDKSPSLRKLYLDYNNIGGVIPTNFVAASTRIEEITLAHNVLIGGVPEDLSYTDGLYLELQENKINNLDDKFCERSDWMDGLVGTEGCNAILCAPEFSSSIGRTHYDYDRSYYTTELNVADTTLEKCTYCSGLSGAKYYGSTSCDPVASEREALEELFTSCGGAKYWLEKSKWMSGDDICEWEGITCNKEGNVISIRLESNRLTGTTPKALFDLRFLEEIWLNSNNVYFNFNGIEKARELVDLRLDDTGLRSLNGIEAAKSLRQLSARKNEVSVFPDGLLELGNLQLLDLGENSIAGKLPESMGNTLNLVYLFLDTNDFTGTVPSFEELGQLRLMELSDNDIEGVIPENFLDGLPAKRSVRVHLEDNQILGSIPETLGRFELLSLFLGGNKIEYVPPSLCLNQRWNNGEVGQFGCPGLICPAGTYNEAGRQSETTGICKVCENAQLLYGQKECDGKPSSGERIRVGFMTATVGLIISWMMTFF